MTYDPSDLRRTDLSRRAAHRTMSEIAADLMYVGSFLQLRQLWPGSGPSYWSKSILARRMTSSNSVAIRCWRSGYWKRLRERTGTYLPLSLLLEGATIRHLASALDAQGAQPDMWRGINVHGTRCPLFWIHGWAELLSMRNYFDADQPVFQIQDPLARRWQVKPRLELSARRYVRRQLRRIQRDGPYQLIGYSFGGVIAYEMARQLLASGERVNFLGLLDTPAPAIRRGRAEHEHDDARGDQEPQDPRVAASQAALLKDPVSPLNGQQCQRDRHSRERVELAGRRGDEGDHHRDRPQSQQPLAV